MRRARYVCIVLLLVTMDQPSASQAKGEAEAELAYLNQIGSLDAIISDDVDALVFGARVVIKK